jgi:hypothetical protein
MYIVIVNRSGAWAPCLVHVSLALVSRRSIDWELLAIHIKIIFIILLESGVIRRKVKNGWCEQFLDTIYILKIQYNI